MDSLPSDGSFDIRAELGRVEPQTPASSVAKRLIEALTAGGVERGTRLPSERQLTESLGVGRSAVREALAALEILGLVQVRPGSGTYLRSDTSELLPTTLNWSLMLNSERLTELAQIRSALEIQATRLACMNTDAGGVETLERHLSTMNETVDDLARFVEADALFHVQIAAMAKNIVLKELLHSVRTLLSVWVERGLQTQEQAETACNEHATIIAAIRNGDPDAAEEAMRHHMGTASERVVQADADPAPIRRETGAPR